MDTFTTPPVRIEKLVPGGNGLGHMDGKVVFVPLAAPGDLVSLCQIRRRKGVLFAEIDNVVEGASCRREPPCPWFGLCGGCQWMHMDYPSQVHWKEEIFRQALRGIAHFREQPPIRIHGASSQFHYRFRARLQIKEAAVGFYRRASNRIVSWKQCLLLPEAVNRAVKDLRALLKDNPPHRELSTCEIALSPVDGSMTLSWIFSDDRDSTGAARKVMDDMEIRLSGRKVQLVGQSARDLRGEVLVARGTALPLEVDGVPMSASPGTFFQVNPAVNAVLVGRVREHLRLAGSATLLDLYCGNGNFSLTSAADGMMTLGVESSPEAVRDALLESGSRSRFVAMDTVRFLKENTERWDAVIVDPPRTGLPPEVSRLLGEKKIPCLIYVSCDPSTLARDLARLSGAGYAVNGMELMDMFPQTSHAEALVVLKG